MNIKTILYKSVKYIVLFFLIFVLIFNTYFLLFKRDFFTMAKLQSVALRQSESYQGRLTLWQLLAQTGDWSNAKKIESQLDPSDITTYKEAYQPENLKKNLKLLNEKGNKNIDDWIELAKINALLGNNDEAKKDIETAHQLDPIRDDLTKLYYLIEK